MTNNEAQYEAVWRGNHRNRVAAGSQPVPGPCPFINLVQPFAFLIIT